MQVSTIPLTADDIISLESRQTASHKALVREAINGQFRTLAGDNWGHF
jgi:hypothetical protein